MPDAFSQSCVAYADQIERAVLDLRVASGPLASLPARCAEFREACLRLSSRRGLDRVTVAVVGSSSAGKTTVASLLARDPDLRSRLVPPAAPSRDRPRRVVWIGPSRPDDLDPASETWITCAPADLEDIGFPYQIADVPGFNDRVADTRATAQRALAASLVTILVLDERELEAAAVRDHVRDCDGGAVLPVVNRASLADPSDLAAFTRDLQQAIPRSRVLPLIAIPDFRERDKSEESVLAAARESLLEALRASAIPPDLESMAQPQLRARADRFRARADRFRAEVARVAAAGLPATASALAALDDAERKLPAEILTEAFGSERALRGILRQRLRSIWVERTPALFFPWRVVAAAANLLWGALDRVPLALLGSIPAIAGAAWTATRNVQRAAEFREATTRGLREQVARQATERLAPRVRSLRESVAVDLGRAPSERDAGGETRVDGIASLQERSSAVFEQILERRAPGKAFCVFAAIIGWALFWAVTGWPLYALYLDYFQAARQTWLQSIDAFRSFPTPSLSLILTSALLGILPLGAWLLLVATWVTRESAVQSAIRETRAAHEEIVASLLESGFLRVHFESPELQAVRVLLREAPGPSDPNRMQDAEASPSKGLQPAREG